MTQSTATTAGTTAGTVAARADRQVDVRTPAGETAGSVTLPGDLFDAPANVSLLHQVVVAQLAAARQGTHATKTRGAVSGGGVKPYRQKGTGRARQGSIRAPQFAGGGIVHGPQPRDYSQRTPKKMKAAALRGALSDRARAGRVHVVTTFVDGDAPRTKAALATLDTISSAKRVLVVLDREDVLNWVSLRNEPRVHLLEAGQLNTYDVLVSDEVVFTRTALGEFVAARHGAGSGGVDTGPTSLTKADRTEPARTEPDVAELDVAEPDVAQPDVAKPDLTTPDIPGAIPSVQPAQGTTDLATADAGSTDAGSTTDSTEEKA